MNEQELPNLLSLMKTGKAISVAPAYPRVASVLDQMREIYELSKEPIIDGILRNLRISGIIIAANISWFSNRE